MNGAFVLVASYPKSGNTWTRILFEKLRRGADKSFSINDLDAKYHGISRRIAFDGWAPANAADLLTEEIQCLLPEIYRRAAAEIGEIVFVKVHDAAKRNRRGEWLYPPDCVPAVIYLVRHPFDVAVSTAHHLSVSLERAVEIMADDGSARPPYRFLSQSLPQIFGSWSGNVVSWLDNAFYRVTFARYEDMCADPEGSFLRLARAAGLQVSSAEVAQAVKATEFRAFQREEAERGFRERPETS
ncbi:MAG TPA: sulfotransferase domain-containing protein, partial [Rhizomicrobium sp.]